MSNLEQFKSINLLLNLHSVMHFNFLTSLDIVITNLHKVIQSLLMHINLQIYLFRCS